MIRPSLFIAFLVPGEVFYPDRHIAFGDIFLKRNMSGFENEIEAIYL